MCGGGWVGGGAAACLLAWEVPQAPVFSLDGPFMAFDIGKRCSLGPT